MNQVYFMMVFLGAVALLPAAAWLVINREKMERKLLFLHFFKITLFYFYCNCFFCATVKWYLGNPEKTLPESFLDMEFRTYIHYGAAALLMDIVILAGVCLLLRKRSNKFVEIFDAWMLIIIVVAIFFSGNISNVVYCAIFIICSVLSLLSVCIGKTEPVYFSSKEYQKAFLGAIPVIGSWFVIIGIYLPNELYISNSNEFMVPYGAFLGVLLIGSVVMAVLLTIVAVMLLPKKFFKLFILFLSGISIMSYFQGMFLNGKLQSLTGDEQTWTQGVQAVNLILWILVIGIIMVSGSYKTFIEKGCKAACVYIMLVQIASLGYLMMAKDIDNVAPQQVLTTEGALEIGNDHNILIFILDRFDSKDFDDLMTDAEFIRPLSDFTYYRNATSLYGNTKEAIPYILEGVEYRYNTERNIFEIYRDAKGDGLFHLSQRGYDIGIYTDANYLSDDLRNIVVNYDKNAEYSCDYFNTIKTMLKASMYRTVPFIIKPRYSYSSSEIYEIAKIEEAWNSLNDLPFYQSLKMDGLYVNNDCKSVFRFYHMNGVHPPYYLSEEVYYDKTAGYTAQSKGCLKIIFEYLEQLKALGKYDDATIIITADHGNPAKRDGREEQLIRISSPIMLVKEAQEQHEDMVINDAPVTQGEMMPAILRAAGMDWTEYGRTFNEVNEDEERERRYQYDDSTCEVIIRYSINGYVKTIDSWNVEDVHHYK